MPNNSSRNVLPRYHEKFQFCSHFLQRYYLLFLRKFEDFLEIGNNMTTTSLLSDDPVLPNCSFKNLLQWQHEGSVTFYLTGVLYQIAADNPIN